MISSKEFLKIVQAEMHNCSVGKKYPATGLTYAQCLTVFADADTTPALPVDEILLTARQFFPID